MEKQISLQREFMQKSKENNRTNFIAAVLTQFFSSVMIIMSGLVLMNIFDAMNNTDFNLLIRTLLAALFIFAGFGIFGMLQKVFINRYLKKALYQVKSFVFKKLLSKSIEEFGDNSSGQFINAFSNDLSLIEQNYLRGTVLLVQQIMGVMIALLGLAYINTVMALCVASISVIPLIYAKFFGTQLSSKEQKSSDENEKLIDHIKDLLNGFFIIKSFKAEKEALEMFEKRNFTLEDTKGERRGTNDTIALISSMLHVFAIVTVATVGAAFVFRNTMTVGAVIGSIQIANYVIGPIKDIVPLLSNRKASLGLISKLVDTIQVNSPKKEMIEIKSLNSSIRFENVTFAYNENKTVLKNINMNFEKGKSYAVVGANGSGKSTLIQLFMRISSEYDGNILIDNNELRNIDLDSLYEVISVVQQNVFLFNSSIKNNITMFKDFNPQKLMLALERSGLSALIEEKGYDYNCGEGGRNLSGGEKQRISIARCLIRETPVLLMDEATAALDSAIAYEIISQILNLKELTRIIVTHKLDEEMLCKYDEIIVMRAGEIAERGTFNKLIAEKGYFYSLYTVDVDLVS